MQSWLARMYDRNRARYLVGCSVAVGLETLIVVAPLVAFFPSRYEGLSVDQFLGVLGLTDGLALLIWGAIAIGLRREILAVLVWAREPHVDLAPAARAGVFNGPRRAALIGFACGVAFVPVIVSALAAPHHHTSPLDWVELSMGALTADALAGLNAWFTLEVLTRPARAELSHPGQDSHRSSLVVRLALIVPAATWLAGFAVAFLTSSRASAGAGHLLVVYGIALAGTGLCLFVLMPLFVGGIVSPIRDLTRATRAVTAGHLDTRVPVTTTDELGELATSFNQMLDELRASRTRIVAASDAARRKVEQDLHDGAQQQLVLLRLKLALLEREPERTELFADVRDDVERALAELRDLAHGLYPPLLESDGLLGALQDAVERAAIPTTLDCDGAGRYRPELEAAVYFCCLEALQNAAKHAGQDARARIRLTSGDRELQFEVADDGQGFDPATASPSAGLQNMTDRIGALGGALRVESQPGAGTKVAGRIPTGQPA